MILTDFSVYLTVAVYMACAAALTQLGTIAGRKRPGRAGGVVRSLLFILPLGIYASAWTFFGAVGAAYQYGYGFLAIYIGISGCYLLAPVLLTPLLEICRTYQLTSIADLFTFRYRSQGSGSLISVFLSLVTLPLLLLQYKALEQLFGFLLGSVGHASLLVLGYWIGLAGLTVWLSRAKLNNGSPDPGMSLLLSVESLVKIIGFGLIGLVTLYHVFDGPHGMEVWLEESALRISSIDRHLEEGPWRALLLVFFSAALTTPHMFHVLLMSPIDRRALFRASWLFPAMLLLLALPVPIILWASIKLSVPMEPQFFLTALGQALGSPLVSVTTIIVLLAAAGGVVLVSVIALSGMLLNHVVLPVYQPVSGRMPSQENLYRWLTRVRRGLAMALFILVAALSTLMPKQLSLSELGLLSLSGSLQLLPGMLAVTYWPTGNRLGLIFSFLTGIASWVAFVMLPMTGITEWLSFSPTLQTAASEFDQNWHIAVLLALGINVFTFVGVSLLFRSTKAELSAAQACSVTGFTHSNPRTLSVHSVKGFLTAIAAQIGQPTARREVLRACRELGLTEDENRPYALRRLRDRLEANLSGLLGPSLARDIIKTALSRRSDKRAFDDQLGAALPATPDITFVETKLERYHDRLTGLAGELDRLRRYHRQILLNLPLAACTVSKDNEILIWNRAFARLSDISADSVVGAHISAASEPWASLLASVIDEPSVRPSSRLLKLDRGDVWVSGYRSSIGDADSSDLGQVIVIEDLTDLKRLEAEVRHSERLASIGKLAAGVAHEIGNPATGIDCLAQNLRLVTDQEDVLLVGAQIRQQTARISGILNSLMSFARSGQPSEHSHMAPVSLVDRAEEAIKLLLLSANETEIAFINQLPADCIVAGDEQLLTQVFINLLSNARDACQSTPPDKKHQVWIYEHQRTEATATIYIEDTGTGMSEQVLQHVFDPFFTTKDPDKGTGLGLALVHRIVEEHSGKIGYHSPLYPAAGERQQSGTRVEISLPLLTSTASRKR